MNRLSWILLASLIGFSFKLTVAGANAMSEQISRGDPPESEIVIVFDGVPNTRFQASLTIDDGGQITTHELEESVPSEYRYKGEVLEARIRQTSQEGALSVEVRKRGNVSRSSSQGQGSEIRLRVR
ncbi:hypothetical protein [Billgrantia ethanolica]|uniref:Uncharacterized protein n=1 Tax=Billgrantia ethanolica TaxID=2733486 RepID=A0ABS9A7N7_9GAMM|nr:hypothetical protein [Halomonas ethanolica]MCE8004816.1 hypothetical protein [Halomonas ethanolica]